MVRRENGQTGTRISRMTVTNTFLLSPTDYATESPRLTGQASTDTLLVVLCASVNRHIPLLPALLSLQIIPWVDHLQTNLPAKCSWRTLYLVGHLI